MKKFILSMLLAVLMMPFAMQADELIIGDGTGSGYYAPFNNFYYHSWNETIYQASEFEGSSSINSIAYHCATPGKTVNTNFVKIYMGETTRSEVASSSDWTPEEDLTLVYHGTDIVLGDTEWEEFVLDTPFAYTGLNNLVVVVAKSATGYNSSLKWYYTDYGNNPCMYYQKDSPASASEYPTNNSGVKYAYSPDIKINYELIPAGPVTVKPASIDLGPRPNNAWMRPYDVTVTPLGGYSNVNAIEATDSYFSMSTIDLPATVYASEPMKIEVTHGEGSGDINAQLAVFYSGGRGVELIDMTAFAYDPVAGDVWEKATEINAYPFTDAPTGIYDNYLLPGETQDGQDAVYKVTFNEDVLLTASVEGENGKVAIYNEDFAGEPGPGATNTYTGIKINTTPDIPTASWLSYDDGTFYTSIGTGGGSFYWGIMFPAEDLQEYVGTSLTKISMYDYLPHTGMFAIYLGGENAPGSLVHVQEYAGTGSAEFVEYEMTAPVAIDGTKNIWVIAVNNDGVTYPAAASAFTGDVNGSWVSLDGVNYMNVVEAGVDPLSWMLRAYVTEGAKGETAYKPIELKNIADGGKLASAMPMDNTRNRGANGINDMVVPAGTYYIAASATEDFTVNINKVAIPLPEKPFNPNPANAEHDFTGQMLSWEFGDYSLEYQVLFGTAFPPQEVVVDWTNELTSAYAVSDLYNNKNYFWQVNVRNTSGTTYGDIWGFTTSFNIPKNISVTANKLYPGESTTLSWSAVEDRSYRGYNVYVNGEKYNNALVKETSYVVENLPYNMDGHQIAVTAVYDEGESDLSSAATVYVTGAGLVEGNVYELDGVTPIGGGTVAVTGKDIFGKEQSYNFEIDAAGKFSGEMLEGEYQAVVAIENYQDTKVRFEVVYNETTVVDVLMTEVYIPVKYVTAKETEAQDGVQVVWGMQFYGNPGEDFETGDFSMNEWNNEVSSYPWAIVEGGCESDYAMKSTCEGVASGVSAIEITVEVPY
ncbi:MAG: fibronectin type III domain-containing protein, partial [Bacteroidales bacterium]|nr:fibronectin type III domain-containing protein [Bacteroidales bacterium]